jgi:hypothetical protein
MKLRNGAVCGFLGTTLLTTIMALAQLFGLTRTSLPFLLGTMFTPDSDRARVWGLGVHFVNGWLFTAMYATAFHSWRRSSWRLGAAIVAVHALFVLVAVLPALPGLHPRMASEQDGPTPTRQLEPPGMLGLNYGSRTPLSILVAHLIFGATLGALYKVD